MKEAETHGRNILATIPPHCAPEFETKRAADRPMDRKSCFRSRMQATKKQGKNLLTYEAFKVLSRFFMLFFLDEKRPHHISSGGANHVKD